jgi:hypothetical protein
MSVALLRQMFEQMVVTKNPDAITRFYAPTFVMDSNGVTQNYDAFLKSHEGVYASDRDCIWETTWPNWADLTAFNDYE